MVASEFIPPNSSGWSIYTLRDDLSSHDRVRNLPYRMSPKEWTRQQLNRLEIGEKLEITPLGKKVKLAIKLVAIYALIFEVEMHPIIS